MEEKIDIRRRIGLELYRIVRHNIARDHPLRQLFWESTLRCNVACRHCGSDCKQKAGIEDMPREDFFRVLDSIAKKVDPHQVFVVVTGGEPLLRDDLIECGRGIYERGFPWGLVTNGQLLTSELLYRLRHEGGVHSLTVSLDGLEEDHNWLRRNKESFRRVSEAIDALVEVPEIMSDVVTCVHQRNYSSLSQIRDFLIEKRMPAWRLYSIFPVGRAASDPLLRLSNEQFKGLLDFIRATRQAGLIKAAYGCEGFLGNYEGDVRDWFFHCQAGITIGSVMADGAIAACASIRSDFNQGNIYEDDFMEVWENRYLPHRNRKWMRTEDCQSCKFWRYCEGNALHLRDKDGRLIFCHLNRITES